MAYQKEIFARHSYVSSFLQTRLFLLKTTHTYILQCSQKHNYEIKDCIDNNYTFTGRTITSEGDLFSADMGVF